MRTVEIPLENLVVDHSSNMRSTLDEKKIAELSASIETHGLINPVTVVPSDIEGEYKLIAGFRRTEAVKKLGRTSVHAVVRPKETTQGDLLMVQMAENIEREDPVVFDTATQIRRIIEATGLTATETAKRLNKSSSWVSNYLGVFDLPEAVQQLTKDGNMTVAQVRFLHPLIKKLGDAQITRIAHNITGMNESELTTYREKLNAKQIIADGGTTAETEQSVEVKQTTTTETADKISTPSNQEDDTEVEVAQRVEDNETLRTEFEIERAVRRLRERYDVLTKSESPTLSRIKLLAAIEALRWTLGDEDVDLLFTDGE